MVWDRCRPVRLGARPPLDLGTAVPIQVGAEVLLSTATVTETTLSLACKSWVALVAVARLTTQDRKLAGL